MDNDKEYTLEGDHKDFLKASIDNESSNSQEHPRDTESTFTILSSNVNVDINLGSLGDVPDNMEVTVDNQNIEQQLKVDSSLSSNQTALLPENLVLVETSKGLILSVADDRFNFTNGLPAVSEDQGRTILTSSLPANIFTQIQPMGVCEDHSGTVYDTVGDGGQVVTTATILQPQPQYIMTTQETDTHQEEQKVKKKNGGGWPKGKKRKPDVQTPRKPMTGYVIFAVKRRQEIKETNPELKFAEVTKLLGQEWSSLLSEEKQTYMQLAEEDKARYISEMEEFQKSDIFQTYVKNKKISSSPKGLTDEMNPLIDLEENSGMNELYCKVCNQFFISIHNKKEHMFGRQHLQNITDQIKKDIQEQAELQRQQMIIATNSLSPSNLDPEGEQNSLQSNMAAGHPEELHQISPSVDINDFIQQFMNKNLDRESEIQLLRKCKQQYEEDNLVISKQVKELEEYESKLDQDLSSLKAYGASLSAQIDALKMVPTLFGVINF